VSVKLSNATAAVPEGCQKFLEISKIHEFHICKVKFSLGSTPKAMVTCSIVVHIGETSLRVIKVWEENRTRSGRAYSISAIFREMEVSLR
jgi:hypothetical protein